MKHINAGIIGLGVGAHHARAIAEVPGCRVAWLCDIDAERLKACGTEHPGARLTVRAEDVLGDPDVGFVVIASYEDAHATQAITAIDRGKHVLLEKPLCQTEDELDKISAALERAPQLVFQSNLIMRRFPRMMELKRSIANGEFGDVYFIEADYAYGRVHKITEGWRGRLPYYSVMAGGGIHVIDAVLWLTGGRVEEVQGYGNRIATAGTQFRFDDFQVALLRLKGGAVAKVSANFACVYPHGHVFNVYGTKKTYVQNALGAANIITRDPEATPTPAPIGALVGKGAFIPRIVDAIRGQAEPEIPRQELLDSMRVCLAIERAIRDRQTIRLT